MKTYELKNYIFDGKLDGRFAELYGCDKIEEARSRYAGALDGFEARFGEQEVNIFSVPGRTELSGNHTDHNLGRVIAASVDLDVIAVATLTLDQKITLLSEGFGEDTVDLATYTEPREDLFGKTAALIAGVAAGFKKNGHNIGGFCVYMTSNVLGGSGLSSSAAFENTVGTLFSHLYNEGGVDNVEIAKISQYAENVFFGKPCGLMDQVACAVGGVVAIDFENKNDPKIEKIDFSPTDAGYALCIVNTGCNHADLTADYAAVPAEMKAVARELGCEVLRQSNRDALMAKMPALRGKISDRALLRAVHYFDENERVLKMTEALKSRNVEAYFEGMIASGRSSYCYLQNVYTTKNVEEQGISLALCLAEGEIRRTGRGAWRVHGGGFAGTIQAFVAREELDSFKTAMENVFGEGACYVLKIRHDGAIRVI